MLKYIGSKRLLVDQIVTVAGALPGVETALDLFSGTSRVGHALKKAGFTVTANDHLAYAHQLGVTYVQADARKWQGEVERRIAEMQALPPEPGYVTRTFCERSRFFHPRNGARIDAMRRYLRESSLEPELKAILTVAMMEAADRVDSTTGVQMAYLKSWAPRAHNDIELRVPAMLPGKGLALHLDAKEAAARTPVDLAYLDPPYNQHSYMGNYHVWETLARGDEPEVYGVACKRLDCRDYKNPFNSKRRARLAFEEVLESLRAKHILVSFNNEGFFDRATMETMLAPHGHLQVVENDFKRYVGAQIGIYNPQGVKVGKVSHLRNKEYLYLVGDEPAPLGAAAAAIREPAQVKFAAA
ncbi:MAG: DNA adenine methylase [Thermoplasmatota archaeon]|nr:DNA adenine methylase [Halobacteriales archaeon]